MKRYSVILCMISVLCAALSGNAMATSDMWFGTSDTNAAEVSSLTTATGSPFSVYVYAKTSNLAGNQEFTGLNLALKWSDSLGYVSFSPSESFLSAIGSNVSVNSNGTLADGSNGYDFETGMLSSKSSWNGLVGTLTLTNGLKTGSSGNVEIWSDGYSWSGASAVYDDVTYGAWFDKPVTVQSIAATPEPGSLTTMVTLMLPCGMMLFRRKRR